MQKKFLLSDPRNQAKHPHITLAVLEFSATEEENVTESIKQILQNWSKNKANPGLKRLDLTEYGEFRSDSPSAPLQTIHLKPLEKHATQLKLINENMKSQLPNNFK